MFLYKILPLTYLPSQHSQLLSYFSSQEINWGALVTIPLGKKLTPGIIIEAQPLPSKLQIKKSTFLLKPIKKVLINQAVLTKKQWELIKWLADFYYNSLAGLARLALPFSLLKNLKEGLFFSESSSFSSKPENFYLFEEDLDFLITKIKETLAKNQQIVFIFPQQLFLEAYLEKLKIFEKELIVFDRQLSSKKLVKIYQEINQNEKKIILGCRSVIFAPFNNLGLVIIYEEENPALETWEGKIHFQAQKGGEKLAELFGSSLILMSQNPSLESWQALKEKKFQTQGKLPGLDWQKITILNVKPLSQSTLFHPQILETISLLQKKKKPQIIIFNNRRGLAPALICEDCGFLFNCPNCDVSLVYHYNHSPYLLCHHCGYQAVPPDLCPNCQSHLIKFLGTGTQRIFKELKKQFPDLVIKCFDSDHLKNLQQEKAIFSQFQEGKINILIATELIFKFLPRLSSLIDLSVLFSVEQILVFPDYRLEERLKRIIQKLNLVSEQLFIQTFDSEREIFKNLRDSFQFYKKELELREHFFYPPFSDIIKIIIKNKKEKEAEKISQECYQILKKELPRFFPKEFYQLSPPLPGFLPKVKGYFLKELILKLKREEALIEKRNQLLNLLPPKIMVKINSYD